MNFRLPRHRDRKQIAPLPDFQPLVIGSGCTKENYPACVADHIRVSDRATFLEECPLYVGRGHWLVKPR